MAMMFMKIHCGGNDYIIANQAQSTATDLPAMARRFCPSRAGAGVDGIVVFTHRGNSCFVIRHFGTDGAESPASDNALRSCARGINWQYGYQSATLIAAGMMLESRIIGDHVGLRFPLAGDVTGPFAVQRRRLYRISIGHDNIVTFTDKVESIVTGNVKSVIRNFSRSSIAKLTINFAEIIGASSLKVRTFDDDAETETLSSGTGALAAALVARRIGLCSQGYIEVQTCPGCSLTVQADGDSGEGTWLDGPTVFSFSGELPCP